MREKYEQKQKGMEKHFLFYQKKKKTERKIGKLLGEMIEEFL